jgi:hypothetical protein
MLFHTQAAPSEWHPPSKSDGTRLGRSIETGRAQQAFGSAANQASASHAVTFNTDPMCRRTGRHLRPNNKLIVRGRLRLAGQLRRSLRKGLLFRCAHFPCLKICEPAGLLPPDGPAFHRVATRCHVIDDGCDDVTAFQFAVDRHMALWQCQFDAGELTLGLTVGPLNDA